MRKVFDEVLLLCPEVKTGGPEALHQLAHQIALHGGVARMVYYAPYSRIEIESGLLRCHAEASPMPEHFAQYDPQVLRETRLGPGTLIVYPEPLLKHAAAQDAVHQRAVWWLSLDNALAQNPELADEGYRRALFADPNLIHFVQSDYTRGFLQAWGAQQLYPLSDYTDPAFVHRSLIASDNPPIAQRPRTVCYFPAKGAELAERFIAGHAALRHAVEFLPIRDMTKAEVRETLFGAQVYIDFGHHPGKDRVPREAAIAGAVVLLHDQGAARCFGDHPLAAAYRFGENDIASGRLNERLDEILGRPEAHFAAQRVYRQAILLERERFDLEVRSFFFTGT
jgi:hypothetical protein